MSMKDIWDKSVREEILGILWIIAAMLAFLSPVAWIRFIGAGFCIIATICFIFSIMFARSERTKENEQVQHCLEPSLIDVEFNVPDAIGKINPTRIALEELAFDKPPTPEMVSEVIIDRVFEWLKSNISISFTCNAGQGKDDNGIDTGQKNEQSQNGVDSR